MNELNEEYIKDLIYETSMRDYIKNKHQSGSKIKYLYYAVSAVAAVIAFLVVSNVFSSSSLSPSEFIQQTYVFPSPTASRSEVKNLAWEHKALLEDKQYQKAINYFQKDSLTLNDQYFKTHIYFVLDSVDAMERCIENLRSNTNAYDDEIDWLLFLDSYRSGVNKDQLQLQYSKLSFSYKEQAKKIMEN